MKSYTYYRIHSENISPHTQEPRGIFAVVGKLFNDKKLSLIEEKEYKIQKQWFEEHLPVPDFYDDGNSIKAITWYKNNKKANDLCNKMTFFMNIASKYKITLFISRVDTLPGELIYEDQFQIGTINCDHHKIDAIKF